MTGIKDLLGDTPYPYGGAAPHQKHSPTSKASADSVKKKIGPLHQRILDWLIANPAGGTDEQIGFDIDMAANTFRPRRRELQLMGRIKDSGRSASTQSGRSAAIWILA